MALITTAITQEGHGQNIEYLLFAVFLPQKNSVSEGIKEQFKPTVLQTGFILFAQTCQFVLPIFELG